MTSLDWDPFLCLMALELTRPPLSLTHKGVLSVDSQRHGVQEAGGGQRCSMQRRGPGGETSLDPTSCFLTALRLGARSLGVSTAPALPLW